MSPVLINGRSLGVEQNGVFTEANTDPIYEGRLWPEAALTWNAMRRAALLDGIQPWEFAPAGTRSSARSLVDQRYFYAHQPPLAAYPGTSNHGWGIAVDVKTQRAAAWLYTNAHKFGWSWDEGQRAGEWWHFRYIGVSKRVRRRIRRRLYYEHFTARERRVVKTFDRLTREDKKPRKRKRLKKKMASRMESIKKQARSEDNGWHKFNRRWRYTALERRVK